jgi:hypothetical protein
MSALQFFLGTHMPGWLGCPLFAKVPLFVSRRALAQRKTLPVAMGPWALDSGGFTELQLHGRWTISARQYVEEVRRFRDEIGWMLWAAPQDWMCEPLVLQGGNGFKGTGRTVEQHQRSTVENFLELRSLAPDLPIIPVIQGWTVYDYWRCEDLYERAGVDLTREPRVGVGTVCRRQGTDVATRIMSTLAVRGLKLHGFGFKMQGLQACHRVLASADSLAWSFAARRDPPLPGHDLPGGIRRTGHINCANCPEYALGWREQLLASIGQGEQPATRRSWTQAELFSEAS